MFFFLKISFQQITMLVNNAGVVSGRALLDTPDHLIERNYLLALKSILRFKLRKKTPIFIYIEMVYFYK